MLTKSQINYINSLQTKKYRQKYQHFVAEGDKIVQELLESHFKIHSIYAKKDWISNFKFQISNFKLLEINENELKKISSLTTPNQVLAIAEISPYSIEQKNLSNKLSIALDNIQDPGNLGTIIRTADWFGIENIFCSADCADTFSPKVVQASMGSIFRVKIHEVDLRDFFTKNKNVPVLGAVLDGENIFEKKFSSKGIILIGNESRGIKKELLSFVSKKISIPKYGKAESLNAAIATGIICAVFNS